MSSLHDIVIIMDNRRQISAVFTAVQVMLHDGKQFFFFVLILSLKLCITFSSENHFYSEETELSIHLSILPFIPANLMLGHGGVESVILGSPESKNIFILYIPL